MHERVKFGKDRYRAPPALKKTHPLGKAPQLVTADGRTIIESSAIAKYLIETYDKVGKFQGDGGKNDVYRDEELCSFSGASISPGMILHTTFDMLVALSPFFVRPIFSMARGQLQKQFLEAEMGAQWQYVNDQLGDQEYLMGSSPGRADFLMSWPVDYCLTRGYIEIEKYPKLDAWHQRCQARPAWKRAAEKGGKYDLSFKM